jgi:hypothetical protein
VVLVRVSAGLAFFGAWCRGFGGRGGLFSEDANDVRGCLAFLTFEASSLPQIPTVLGRMSDVSVIWNV